MQRKKKEDRKKWYEVHRKGKKDRRRKGGQERKWK